MSSYIRTCYVDCRVTGWKPIHGLKVEFEFVAHSLAEGQKQTVRKYLKRGFGVGSKSECGMAFDLLMLANNPRYMIYVGGAQTMFRLDCMERTDQALIQELDRQLFAYHKLVAPSPPAWLMNRDRFLDKDGYARGTTGALATYKSPFDYYRTDGKVTSYRYQKTLGEEAIKILGPDPARERALEMFDAAAHLWVTVNADGRLKVRRI
jgi:hypothetical protein